MSYPVLRPILLLGLSAAIFVAPRSLAGEENWPQFRGPDGQGHSDATGLPLHWSETENIVWKTPIHGSGWSSPVVWGDQIWLTTATDDGKQRFAICVDRQSGKVLHDLKLFEIADPSATRQYNSYASPTPVIEAGRVYISFGSAGTACLDTADGHVVWHRTDLPCNHYRGAGSSPVLFENLLFLHFDGYDFQYIVALDKRTGKTVWRHDRDVDYGTKDGDMKKAFSTPLVIDVAGQLQLISPFSKATIAYDPRTGKDLWRMHYSSFSTAARPVYGGGLLFLNTGFGKADLLAVRPGGADGNATASGDISATNIVWKLSKSIGSKPSALLVGDLIFVVHDSGVASCVEAKTGNFLWSKRLGGSFSASPIAAEGRVYFVGENGTTTVVRAARSYEELAANHLDDGSMSSPAVTGHALILRTNTNLYRIEHAAAAAVGGADIDTVLKSVRGRVPMGWVVTAGHGGFGVTSPNEMPLHAAPYGGLNGGSTRARCSITINIGEKISTADRKQRWQDHQKKEHYKGAPHTWMPDFYDEHNGYEVRLPSYCPDTEEDEESVADCYKAITRQWSVYPTSRFEDKNFFSDAIKTLGSRPVPKNEGVKKGTFWFI